MGYYIDDVQFIFEYEFVNINYNIIMKRLLKILGEAAVEPTRWSDRLKKERPSIIAVDFDGTVVKHAFPEIGKELEDATAVLGEIQKLGSKIILWTVRSGKELKEALAFLKERGFVPDAVNENVPEGKVSTSPKVYADEYWDDRSYPAFPGWAAIRKRWL